MHGVYVSACIAKVCGYGVERVLTYDILLDSSKLFLLYVSQCFWSDVDIYQLPPSILGDTCLDRPVLVELGQSDI